MGSTDRRLSNLQLGMNPIDANHLDSLFDDGTNAGLALGLQQNEADALRQAMRRQSLLQSLNKNSSNSTNAQTIANQAQLVNNQLAIAQQQQQQYLQAATISAASKKNKNNDAAMASAAAEANPELPQEQVTPFLTAVESLQDKMQQSQLSQKSIQSWDKKMGLKRSHSSTMTKTHRSRKQLRELFEMQKKFLEQRMGKKKGDKSTGQKSDKSNGF